MSPSLGIKSRSVKLAIWTLYVALLAVVSVSRVFLGCHFPHQCLAGAVLGFLLAKYISTLEIRPIHFIVGSLFLFTTAFATFAILQALDFDPNWTIKLATKHCEKRDYIHVDTAPFFSIMRYCGFALGCGLGLLLPLKSYVQQMVPVDGHLLVQATPGAKDDSVGLLGSQNFSWLTVKMLMALLMARLADNLGLFVSHANLSLFYSSAFFTYATFSYAFTQL